MPRKKKGRGRPPLEMPEQIPDTPENVARALMRNPPKWADEWEYMKEYQRQLALRRAEMDE